MNELSLIVLARAVHVLSGVAWAGATFVMAGVVVPLLARHGAEGAGRWLGMVGRRAGRASMVAALLTIVSGGYLFSALHPHDTSASGLVLKSGAVAALLSLAVGLLIVRPIGLSLARLQEPRPEGTPPGADVLQRMATLRQRVAIGSRVAAGLLGASVLAMAVFRYAAAV
ncbi:MAG: putative rane protein [Nevskia sp.]|nr:putative rane protein [Nevskia sp.]